VFNWLKHWSRDGVRRRPIPVAWRTIIDKNVPYATRIPSADRRELDEHVQVFLAEKRFEGCAGLEITDEIRVTIAAQACVLLLHRKATYYPNLVSILVYPTIYRTPGSEVTSDGRPNEPAQARLGESWNRDVLVLAWDSVVSVASGMHDCHNVVLHEFAHQLDQEDGTADGAPILPQRSMYFAWARVLGHDFDQLVRETERHHRTLIDRYGATSPAEFFAVATETFFEKPRQLRAKHPALYLELQQFYCQDPASLNLDR
jgi:MtfA peptidase